LLQHVAPVVNYLRSDNITALLYYVNVSNVITLFVLLTNLEIK